MLLVNQLAGFGAGGKPPLVLTQVLSATDNADGAFTLPSGILAGDLIINFDYARDINNPSDVVPGGFNKVTTVASGGSPAGRATLNYKIAVGTEGGTSVTGLNGSAELHLVYVFRGNRPITSVAFSDIETEITNGNPSAKTVSASAGTSPLIVLGCYGTGIGTVDPRSFSPTKDGEINANSTGPNDAWLAYKIYNSSPQDVAIDMDDEGNQNALITAYVTCSAD